MTIISSNPKVYFLQYQDGHPTQEEMGEIIGELDFIYMTRLQKERGMSDPAKILKTLRAAHKMIKARVPCGTFDRPSDCLDQGRMDIACTRCDLLADLDRDIYDVYRKVLD